VTELVLTNEWQLTAGRPCRMARINTPAFLGE